MNPNDSLDRLNELHKVYQWIAMALPTMSDGTVCNVFLVEKPHSFVMRFNDGTPDIRIYMDWADSTQGA